MNGGEKTIIIAMGRHVALPCEAHRTARLHGLRPVLIEWYFRKLDELIQIHPLNKTNR